MPEEHVFTDYCAKCGTTFRYPFKKEQLLNRGGGLYSGIFFHRGKNNEEIHAALAYFDNDLAHRGTESSKVIQTALSSEHLQESALLSLKEELDNKQDIKVFYEWFINEYIFYFKSIKLLVMKQVCPILTKILEDLKSQSKIYEYFVLISDEVSDRIVFDLQMKDAHMIKGSEMKKACQKIFNQIRTHFKEEDSNDALEASKRLGLKMVTQWRELVKLGLSEDIFRTLEVLLFFKDFSEE